jgi:hypothetical protein
MYRTVIVAFACLILAACGTRSAETDAVAARARDCLVRETQAIASQSIDLETATFAVLARCDYPGEIERSIAAEVPGGFREYVHQAVQRRYADIIDSTRRRIALVRAQTGHPYARRSDSP